MSRVIIGMDPHKRSATIEVMAGDEAILGGGRYATDAAGYAAMLARVRQWPERVWAMEGCQGIVRTWPADCSPAVSRSLMCWPSCRRGCGCSPPVRAASC